MPAISKQILFIAIFLGVFSLWQKAEADTHTAASCSYADVSSTVAAAENGDTVSIPAGECTWADKITLTKAVTIAGAGTASPITKIIRDANYTGSVYTGYPFFYISPSSDQTGAMLISIEGIYFDSFNDGYTHSIKISGSGHAISRLRIDNCVFNQGKRAVYAVGWVKGVIYKNTFINCDIGVGICGDNNAAWERSIEAGTNE